MRSRTLLMGIFVFGLAAGIVLTLMLVVEPRAHPVSALQIPTPEPTPPLPDEAIYSRLEAYDQVITSLYARVSPSVVHITSLQQTITRFYGVQPQEGTGSGFVYDDNGHIVTNNHVIAGATDITVLLANGISLPAQVVGTDNYYDLAVLKVDVPPGTLTPLELGDSSALQVGQSVIAIGNPFGLDRTLTTGVISALERRIDTEGSVIGQAIQTDAAINPGNSGGPLLDLRGRVVGINTAINSPSGGSVGIGFAVPVNIVSHVIPSLISTGRFIHPTLGIQVAELGTEVRMSADTVQSGLLIVDVAVGSTAQAAGLQPATVTVQRRRYVINGGDIITAIDGQPLISRNDLLLYLEENRVPGDTVTLSIVRNGAPLEVTMTVGAG
ncbi:MAG: trypsin-like peptidase domain-containing protein [Anaerolineae bacterium]|nr:trypsin-like peptidase domain-containing protein [Anaerolineae bacterium]